MVRPVPLFRRGLVIPEDLPASLEQQPFRLQLNRLDHVPVLPLARLPPFWRNDSNGTRVAGYCLLSMPKRLDLLDLSFR